MLYVEHIFIRERITMNEKYRSIWKFGSYDNNSSFDMNFKTHIMEVSYFPDRIFWFYHPPWSEILLDWVFVLPQDKEDSRPRIWRTLSLLHEPTLVQLDCKTWFQFLQDWIPLHYLTEKRSSGCKVYQLKSKNII